MSPRISSEKTPTVSVFSSAGGTKTSAYRNSFQDNVKANKAAPITAGPAHAGHRDRQQDPDQGLQPVAPVEHRALLDLLRHRPEIAHEDPGAERDQEGRVGDDER